MIKRIVSAKRYEDGLVKIEMDEDYIAIHKEDKELAELIDEFTEIFYNTKTLKGQEVYPDYTEIGITKDGYCRMTSYPAVKELN